MKNVIQGFFFIVLIFVSSTVWAQKVDISESVDTTKTYKIELNDGSVFIGTILLKNAITIVIKTSSIPKLEIPVSEVKTIEIVKESSIKNGVYRISNPHTTRYLIGPSAFNLKRGEWYYQNTWLFLNSLNVGISDHFSMGGGLEFISTLGSIAAGSFDPIFYITPKMDFDAKDNFRAGVGLLYINVPGVFDSDRTSSGIAYGIGTFGDTENNLTIGMGWGFVESKFSSKPFVTISGMSRMGKRTSFVTENWLIPTGGYSGLYSYGIRFFGESTSYDLAFINNSDISKFLVIGVPFLSFTVKF